MSWPRRRQLLLIENVAFLACLIVGLVLLFTIPSIGGKIIVAACLAGAMGLQGALRRSGFRNVLPELREERRGITPSIVRPAADEETDILWEDDLAAIQSARERYVIIGLTALVAILSTLGIVIGLLAPHPRTSFEGLAFGFYGVSLWFVVMESGALWLAWRSRWAMDHPHARFGPVAVSGGALLLLILMADGLALGAIKAPFSSRSWAMLTICLLITLILLIWELVIFRRSILDGAWRGLISSRDMPPTTS